ncbi:MAG: NADH-quinone oxidoreductase subunit N [Chitinophagales bacterium]
MEWMNTVLAMKFELALTLIIFLLLFVKINGKSENESVIRLTNLLLVVNFALGFFWNKDAQLFGEMFKSNGLLAIEKNVLNLATLIISLFSYDWLKRHKHVAEFYLLMLSSLLGLFFMLSSGNLLMFYLGLELSTIPLAALCNFDLEKKASGEAAFKMILSSAFSSAILLFGISLIYGSCGTVNFSEISMNLSGGKMQLLALIIVFTGFAFKLSVVPFHLWTADVYEGAPVAVTAYLSVVSKGAMAFAFISTFYTAFANMAVTWYYLLAFGAAVSMLVGNLFAMRQNNLKRFLAFSSIAQVGYLLIGISSVTAAGVASVVFFVLIYVFSNLAAFGVVSVISATTGRETIEQYKGLYKTNPALALIMALALFSLAGIPPTAGFFGKLFLLTTGAAMGQWWLIIFASLNLIVSLYYYLRIVRAMFVDESSEPLSKLSLNSAAFIALILCVLGIVVTGFVGKTFDVIFEMAAKM